MNALPLGSAPTNPCPPVMGSRAAGGTSKPYSGRPAFYTLARSPPEPLGDLWRTRPGCARRLRWGSLPEPRADAAQRTVRLLYLSARGPDEEVPPPTRLFCLSQRRRHAPVRVASRAAGGTSEPYSGTRRTPIADWSARVRDLRRSRILLCILPASGGRPGPVNPCRPGGGSIRLRAAMKGWPARTPMRCASCSPRRRPARPACKTCCRRSPRAPTRRTRRSPGCCGKRIGGTRTRH
jgi:hypothetical protein